MIKELFIPYEQALKLKELEFDEDCLGYYVGKDKKVFIVDGKIVSKTDMGLDSKVSFRAPTWSQAFDWFRKVHNLHSYLSPKVKYPDNAVDRNEYYYSILSNNKNYGDDGIRSYEEARLACLDKLIEQIN